MSLEDAINRLAAAIEASNVKRPDMDFSEFVKDVAAPLPEAPTPEAAEVAPAPVAEKRKPGRPPKPAPVPEPATVVETALVTAPDPQPELAPTATIAITDETLKVEALQFAAKHTTDGLVALFASFGKAKMSEVIAAGLTEQVVLAMRAKG